MSNLASAAPETIGKPAAMDDRGGIVLVLGGHRQRRLRGVHAIGLSKADIVELVLGEEALQFIEPARELRQRLSLLVRIERCVARAPGQGLKRGEPGIERKQLLVIARGAKIGIELGARVEERLRAESALDHTSSLGRDACVQTGAIGR